MRGGDIMATRADIVCKNCGNTFHVFWHGWEKQLPLECPYCCKKIGEKMTEMVKHALGCTWEANYHFRKYNEERNEPLFEVNFTEVYVPIDKFDLDD